MLHFHEFGYRLFQNISIAAKSEACSIRQVLSKTMAVGAFGVNGFHFGRALVFGLPVFANASHTSAIFSDSARASAVPPVTCGIASLVRKTSGISISWCDMPRPSKVFARHWHQ
jgi:hypothetical protein